MNAVIEFADVHVYSQAPARGELAGTPNRVTFRWENGHAYEVRVEDYH